MKKIFLILFLLFFIFSPLFQIKADGLVPCGGLCQKYTKDDKGNEICIYPPPCTLSYFFIMIANIINFLLIYIVPGVAALMIAIGGFMLIIAYAGGGGSDMISRARSLFTAVIIGLVIVYGSWLIIEVFFATIGVKPMFRSWNSIF